MLLLVGLGNPGDKYERTRHNVGFRVAERVARACGAALDQSRWGATYGVGRLKGDSLAVLLPQTYMNASGEAAGPAARFWKVDPGSVAVVHDELDFEFGRLGLKQGGGDGGHNGLKSLRQHLSPDTLRVRVGIGRPPPQWDPADWVLSRFTSDEEAALEAEGGILDSARDACLGLFTQGLTKAMNRFNTRPKAPPKAAPTSHHPTPPGSTPGGGGPKP